MKIVISNHFMLIQFHTEVDFSLEISWSLSQDLDSILNLTNRMKWANMMTAAQSMRIVVEIIAMTKCQPNKNKEVSTVPSCQTVINHKTNSPASKNRTITFSLTQILDVNGIFLAITDTQNDILWSVSMTKNLFLYQSVSQSNRMNLQIR